MNSNEVTFDKWCTMIGALYEALLAANQSGDSKELDKLIEGLPPYLKIELITGSEHPQITLSLPSPSNIDRETLLKAHSALVAMYPLAATIGKLS